MDYYEESELYLEEFLKMPKKVQQLLLMNNIKEKIYPDVFICDFDSPIEQIFITAYDMYCTILNKTRFYLDSQKEIIVNGKKYFADFVFEFDSCINHYNIERPLVIECDGYDFHQKTKEQVIRDNERELALKFAGFDVIRFSGSQIYRNPLKCVDDAYKYIQKLIKED